MIPPLVFKIGGPFWVTLLNCTPIFEWFMTKIEYKNEHEKDVCNNETGLCSQNILGVLGSMVNVIT